MIRLREDDRVQTELVAVYGTLRRLGTSNSYMNSFEYLGTFELPQFQMYKMGNYPFVYWTGDATKNIVVDIYRFFDYLDDSLLQAHGRLDYYEHVNKGMYEVCLFEARFPHMGAEFKVIKIYISPDNELPSTGIPIPSGDWQGKNLTLPKLIL